MKLLIIIFLVGCLNNNHISENSLTFIYEIFFSYITQINSSQKDFVVLSICLELYACMYAFAFLVYQWNKRKITVEHKKLGMQPTASYHKLNKAKLLIVRDVQILTFFCQVYYLNVII